MANAATAMKHSTGIYGWSDRDIIFRYERLVASNTNPLACFVCEKVRPLVNALVAGPCDDSVALNPRPATIGHGHGVCRPCVKRGEAVAYRGGC